MSQSNVRSFPNPSTQFKPGVGGFPRGQPKPAIGKRRARRLKLAVAMVEAVHGPAPVFEGDSVDFLRAVMKGEIAPDPARMAAAMALSRFEHPTSSATAVAVNGGQTLEQLVAAASSEERTARAMGLIERTRRTLGDVPGKLIEPPAAIEPDTSAAEMRASIAKAEAEQAAILTDIAREEQKCEAEDRAQQDRLRTCGIDYLPKRY